MATKPKNTTTYEDRLHQAERDWIESQDKAHEAALAAAQRHQRTTEALEAAEDALSESLASYAGSDDSKVTPEGYAADKAAVELLEARLKLTERASDRAGKAVKHAGDVEVAEALQRIAQSAVGLEVPVYVTTTTPPTPDRIELTRPLLVIQQVAPTRRHEDGAVYCTVLRKGQTRLDQGDPGIRLHYFRGRLNTEFNPEAVVEVVHRESGRIEVIFGSSDGAAGDGVRVDTAHVKVTGIVPGLIEVHDPEPAVLGREYATIAARETGIPGWAIRRDDQGFIRGSNLALAVGSSKVLDTSVTDGEREQRIEVRLELNIVGENRYDIDVALPEIARRMTSTTLPGLGVVDGLEFDRRGNEVTLAAVVRSAVPEAVAA